MSEITEQNQDRLIIVIPAYNEEENIENVVAQWHPIVEKTGGDSRLFVINDGSTDRTQEELDQLQGKYPQLRTVKKKTRDTVPLFYMATAVRLRKGQIIFFRQILMDRLCRKNSGSCGKTGKSVGF